MKLKQIYFGKTRIITFKEATVIKKGNLIEIEFKNHKVLIDLKSKPIPKIEGNYPYVAIYIPNIGSLNNR